MSSRFQRPPMRGAVAPIHRGPQALPPGTSASPGGYYNMHAPNAALLIDFDNVTMGIQKDMQSELRNLLSSDIIKGKVSVQRAYADWRRYPGYIVPLTEASIDLIFAPAYGSAKKNATDIRLAIDAMELVFTRPEIGTFILLSGDSDFSSLVIKLKEYGKYVIGVGIRESSSDLLVQNCDEYYSYNALAGLVKTGDEETVRWDPWELVVEAVGRMVKNGDVMRADRLKQVMQDVDPSFDEKDLGMSKFSRFVHEAEKRGLLTLTKQENGQYEIGQTRLPASTSAAPVAPAAESAERAERAERERSRRGRGRGRGRGRDFERGPRREDGEEGGAEETIETPLLELPVEREPKPAKPAKPAAFTIGASGERLTRAEAFDLVRRAVESLTRDEGDSVSSREVRVRAFELLGRDSESLTERMFVRILQDAHDSNLVDLRRRGDDYELSRAAEADSVADQLNRAAAAAQAAEPAAVVTPGPRGMGPRGGGGRGRAPVGRAAPPPELLSIGVVASAATASAPAAAAAPVAPFVAADVPVVLPVAAAQAATPAAPAASAPAQPPRRGRGPAGRGAPPPELLSIGVVSPVKPVTEALPETPAITPTVAVPPVAAPSAEPAAAGAPARAGRGRGGRGRGRGRAGEAGAPTPAGAAPAPPPGAAPGAAPAPAAAAPAAPARGRGRGGPPAAKTPAARTPAARTPAAKPPAKVPAKAAAKAPGRGAAKVAAPAPAAPAPAAPAAAKTPRAPRGGARKTAAKRGA